MLKSVFVRIKKSEFAVNVLTLMTGTTIAQAFPIAFSPILTRIYEPEDLGTLAIYLSIVAIFSNLITLKYELAIIIPEKDEDSASLTVLSILIAAILSVVILIIVIIFNTELTDLFGRGNKEISKWLYFVPITIFFIGVYNSLSYWFNRKKEYKTLAVSKVVNMSGMTFSQIIFGLFKMIPIGLLFGVILGRLLSVLMLVKRAFKKGNTSIYSIATKKRMKIQANKYKRFPIYSLPADSINVISNQLPVFFIGKYFGADILGNYALMERILGAPVSLIGKAVSDVFRQKASEDYITKGNCEEIFLKTLKTLSLFAIAPTLLLFFVAPVVFDFIFGEEWRIAGELAQIMAVLFFFRFVISPLGYMFYIAEKQNYDTIWQVGLLIGTVMSFMFGIYKNSYQVALISFSIVYSILYVVNLYLSYTFAKGKKS